MTMQLNLITSVIQKLEDSGTVLSFELRHRKGVAKLVAEDLNIIESKQAEFAVNWDFATIAGREPCPEAWLAPYMGRGKSFSDVHEFIADIQEFAKENDSCPYQFEILPIFRGSAGPKPVKIPRKSLAATSKPTGIQKKASAGAKAGASQLRSGSDKRKQQIHVKENEGGCQIVVSTLPFPYLIQH